MIANTHQQLAQYAFRLSLRSSTVTSRNIARLTPVFPNIDIKQTLEFPEAEINDEGIMILDLRTAQISRRSQNNHMRKDRVLLKPARERVADVSATLADL